MLQNDFYKHVIPNNNNNQTQDVQRNNANTILFRRNFRHNIEANNKSE